ncbi:hypothetical protein [Bacillus cereus]|uniref:hypothetical protein n=2 Tax=Bacillus cereus group TaxID=86661 RepID=UPI001C8B5770|nr:hypothetical protein [Bacillus cereus]MBX9158436.1 hypothetical protein [Bacillus cereus]
MNKVELMLRGYVMMLEDEDVRVKLSKSTFGLNELYGVGFKASYIEEENKIAVYKMENDAWEMVGSTKLVD